VAEPSERRPHIARQQSARAQACAPPNWTGTAAADALPAAVPDALPAGQFTQHPGKHGVAESYASATSALLARGKSAVLPAFLSVASVTCRLLRVTQADLQTAGFAKGMCTVVHIQGHTATGLVHWSGAT
jgi:hypothetical protein